MFPQVKLTFFILVLIFNHGVLAVEHFVISRVPQQIGDSFEIPSSVCQGVSSAHNCEVYEALQGNSVCHCKCPSSRASLLYNGSTWKCTDDRIQRRKEKCAVLAGSETVTDPLQVLQPIPSRMWLLKALNGKNKSCSIDLNLSRYLDCFGSWKPLYSVNKIATIETLDDTAFLKIIPGKIKHDTGRIIRLVFTAGCGVSGNVAPCLLVKLKGNTTCPMKELTKASTLDHSRKDEQVTTQTPIKNLTLAARGGNDSTSSQYIIIVSLVASAVTILFVAIFSLLGNLLCRRQRRTKCVLYPNLRARPSLRNQIDGNDKKFPLPSIEGNVKDLELSFLNLGFVSLCQLEEDVQHGSKDFRFSSSRAYFGAKHGNVLSYSNPVALDDPQDTTSISVHSEGSSAISNADVKGNCESDAKVSEPSLESSAKESQQLAPTELVGEMGQNYSRTKLMYIKNHALSQSLESIDSGYDNVTLCDDSVDETKSENSSESDHEDECKNTFEEGRVQENEESSKAVPSGGLLEDILKDLKDKEIMRENTLFTLPNSE